MIRVGPLEGLEGHLPVSSLDFQACRLLQGLLWELLSSPPIPLTNGIVENQHTVQNGGKRPRKAPFGV